MELPTISPKHRTWAEIKPANLQHNLRVIKETLPKGTFTVAVIKANAYGHGAETAAEALKEYADCFMVAEISEALTLREHGITLPILIAGYTNPSYASVLAEYELIQCVFDFEYGKALHKNLAPHQRLKVHLKIDTGMARLGLSCKKEETVTQIQELCRMPRLLCEGIFSHFAESEQEDGNYTLLQEKRFCSLLQTLSEKEILFKYRHISNSASGMLGIPSFCNGARIGISLYGVYPSPYVKAQWLKLHPQSGLKPVMELKTRIAQIREQNAGESVGYNRRFTPQSNTRIAVLTAGYGDGLARSLTQRGGAPVIAEGVRLVGSVCMDMCFADLSGSKNTLHHGDEVTLFGSELIGADDWAKQCNTISYEIFCNITARVPRVVIKKK